MPTRRTVRIFATVSGLFSVLMLLITLFAGRTFAAGPDMITFFQGLEGRWRGTGKIRTLQQSGSIIETPFRGDLRVQDLPRTQDTWQYDAQSRFPNGAVTLESGKFAVEQGGDFLFVSKAQYPDELEAAMVETSTPMSLKYHVVRMDAFGRLVQSTFSYTISGSGRTLQLEIQNTLVIGADLVRESTFEGELR